MGICCSTNHPGLGPDRQHPRASPSSSIFARVLGAAQTLGAAACRQLPTTRDKRPIAESERSWDPGTDGPRGTEGQAVTRHGGAIDNEQG